MRAAVLHLPALRLPAALREHGLSLGVLLVTLGLYLLAGLSLALADTAPELPATPAAQAGTEARLQGAPPPPEPLAFQQVAPQDAQAINAAVPVSALPNPAAAPFRLPAVSEADRLRSLECLTAAVYYEAAVEPLDGQRAVAQVVLNRVRHPAYPNTVCGVVYQGSERATGCQFTFTCDGSLRRTPSASYWARAREVAQAALSGHVFAPVGWATHYHTNWVVPYWSSSLVKAANVGTHIFYRWTGGWGRPPAFTSRHPGVEPAISRSAILAAQEQARLAAAAAAETAAATAAAAPGADPEAAAPVAADMAQRPVVRRYEPLRRETAVELIEQRSGSGLSAEQRWALTGQGEGGGDPGLGRQGPPVLEGVRRRVATAAPAPATPAPAPPEGGTEPATTR